jgi:hypothetical protein
MENATSNTRCRATRVDGTPCRAKARPGKAHCPFHDPDLEQKRQAARRAGGIKSRTRNAVLPPSTPDTALRTVTDVAAFLGQTINQTRRGELDPRVTNAIVGAANVLLKALEGSDLQRQIEELRREVQEGRNRGTGDTAAGADAAAGPGGPAEGPGAPLPGSNQGAGGLPR